MVVLESVFGVLGYLVVGWACVVVASAMNLSDGSSYRSKANHAWAAWWWLLPGWAPALVLAVVLMPFALLIQWTAPVTKAVVGFFPAVSLWAGKKLNPKMEGWYTE